MGLDQAFRVVRKPSDEDIEFLRTHFVDESPLASFDIAEIRADGNYHLIADLEPYSVTVRSKHHGFNEKLLRSDFGVPAEASIRGIGDQGGETVITYGTYDEEGNRKSYVATVNDSNRKRYETVVEADFLVCEMSTICTLRKNYDVQEIVYAHMPVENCGYYVLDNETIDDLVDAGIGLLGYETNDEKGVVYWEWY